MNAQELKDYFRDTLVPQRTIAQEFLALDALVDFASQNDTTSIPDWTNALTFQLDGTDDGTFCTEPDTNGRIRFFKTKVDDNTNNSPPTDPLITENAYWIEVSPADGSAVKEWTPGVYGAGLIIVYFDISGTGADPDLYVLAEPTRPYNSTNFTTELAAGKWKRMQTVFDVAATGGTDVMNIGTANADVINIGRVGATVNIYGNTIYSQVTNLEVSDKLIRLNRGGGAASASGSGFELEENAVVTGYIKTTSDRNGYELKAPNVGYKATLDFSVLAADRSYTLPNNSGTLALLSDIGGGSAWSLATGGTLTGVNTITSNTANQLNFNGTWTATANNQFMAQFGGTLTSRNTASDVLFGYLINPTLTRNGSNPATQTAYGLYINPTFTNSFTNQYALGVNGGAVFRGTTKFIISTTGNDYNTDIGSGSETGPTLYLARQFAVGTTNEHGLIIRDLFQSATYAYATFDAQTQFATAKTYNHYAGFQERAELLGTASVTNYYAFYSAATIPSGATIGNFYGLRISHASINAGATISSTSYGVRVETLKGPGKWAFYSDVDNSYFGGKVNIGSLTASRNLNVFASTPTIGMGISTTEYFILSIASAGNVGITGSVLGDAIFRTVSTRFLFSSDNGTTIHFRTGANGAAIIQGVLSASWAPSLTVTPGAHTSMTAATEFVSNNFVGASQQWVSGTVSTQRFNYFRAFTVTGASATNTITNAYTIYVDASIVGSNAAITNNWAAGFNGGVKVNGALIIADSISDTPTANTKVDIRGVNSGNILRGASNINSEIFVITNGGVYTWKQDAVNATSGTMMEFRPGSHTNLPASTESYDLIFTLNRTVTWATGDIPLQRSIRISGPVWAFNGGSTISDGYTVFIDSPTAGTNSTLTRKYALGLSDSLGIDIGSTVTSVKENSISLSARDSSDGSANSTIALYLEQVVEAIGTFTPSHKLKIWINGTEYWIQLDAV